MKAADIDRRVVALAQAAELAEGRLDPAVVAAAREVVDRAGVRLGLGLHETVVALAGPTGAGKSSLFNALAGAQLTRSGRRRPTTAATSAAVWGGDAGPLLDWLEVPTRHRIHTPEPDGLVLLDLPDFDSIALQNRDEVDRVVGIADLVIWVVDPQKYADASLHDRYLRPLAGYSQAMAVVLNQADLLSPQALADCIADIDRLLESDGLKDLPVLAVSATRGDGLDDLRGLLADRVRAREAALARLAADVERRAAEFDAGCADPQRPRVSQQDRSQLTAALAVAAGVPTLTTAVARAHKRRGALATGWPYGRWLRRLRPDPLRRLHLSDAVKKRGELEPGDGPALPPSSSLPAPSPVARAQVGAAVRGLASGAAGDLPQPWPRLVHDAASSSEERLAARLDAAVAGTDLRVTRPRWWSLAGALQYLIAAVVLVGALWLVAKAAAGLLQVEAAIPLGDVEGIPIPSAMIIGGVLIGLVLAFLLGRINAFSARRRSNAAGKALRAAVAEVGDELVVAPAQAELGVREQLCGALARCGPPSSRLRDRVLRR